MTESGSFVQEGIQMTLVTFYQLITQPGAPHMAPPRFPQRAQVDADGSIPARALRYCEAIRTANAYGYYLYLPMDLSLRFNGVETECSIDEDGTGTGSNWWPLNASAHFPGFPTHFNQIAPVYLRDMVPPLVAPGESHGTIQLWCGSIARTEKDWSLLVRGPVNDSRRSLGYEVLEGIIETDRWGGHLFANIKLLRTDTVITIHAHHAFIQVVPVHRDSYSDAHLDDFAINTEVPDEIWKSYGEIVIGKIVGSRPIGAYAVDVRKRRAAEGR
jgi:hypothetical protein